MTILQISPGLSRKLRVVSFFSIVLVLVNHACITGLNLRAGIFTLEGGSPGQLFLQFLSAGIGRVNRPLFFIIAGFLFFLTFNGAWQSYRDKMLTRLRTLAIPYALFSSVTLLLYTAAYLTKLSSLPIFRGHADWCFDSFARFLELFVDNPVAVQLWFIRDLLLIAALSPLIFAFLAVTGAKLLVFVVIIWASGLLPQWELLQSFLFFGCGAFLTRHLNLVERTNFPAKLKWVSVVAWVTFSIIQVTTSYWDFPLMTFQKLSMFAGVVAVWSNYHSLPIAWVSRMHTLGRFTFFIYLFHNPLVLMPLAKLFFVMFGHNQWTAALVPFIFVPISIALCIGLAKLLLVHCPSLYSIIVGGRGVDSPIGMPLSNHVVHA